jgi:hypothetical protein
VQWVGIIQEIKALSNQLPECEFRHVRRDGNRIAHQLAQHALKLAECVVMRFEALEGVHNQCSIEAEWTGRSSACNHVSDH